jgi:hypothetical protein
MLTPGPIEDCQPGSGIEGLHSCDHCMGVVDVSQHILAGGRDEAPGVRGLAASR